MIKMIKNETKKITLNNLINESNVYTKIYGGNYGTAKLIELTICAQKGDMEAFSNLIISFEQDLYRIASITLKNPGHIDDVKQMTIEQTFKKY